MIFAMDDAQPGAERNYSVATKEDFLAFYRVAVRPAYRAASRLAGGDRARCDDIVQEVFMDLVRQVRSGRITTIDVGWVIVAVRHRFLDTIRRRDREDRRLRLVWSQPPVASPGDEQGGVIDLLGRLSDAQRIAVVLHHVDGLPVADVATMLGRSVRATESLLARGRHELRRMMGERS